MTAYYKRTGVDGDLHTNKVSLSTKLILETARQYGITCVEVPYTGLFSLTYRGKVEYLHPQPPSLNTRTSVYCCDNKAITKSILKSQKISTPKGYIIQKSDHVNYLLSVYKSLQKPIVVKPINSSLAKNVYTGITSQGKYLKAIKTIIRYYGKTSEKILVEEMFVGTEYRIIATRKKVVGIMSRIPANVMGNGINTIRELVQKKNMHIWRGGDFGLHTITLGKIEKAYLKQQGLTVKDIPRKNNRIFLRKQSTTNIDHGGDTIDCTNLVHPSVKKIAIKAVCSIPGLEWAGIDYFSKDITKVQSPKKYIVLEINTSPNIAWQEFPALGKRREVALEYLKLIFPDLNNQSQFDNPKRLLNQKSLTSTTNQIFPGLALPVIA